MAGDHFARITLAYFGGVEGRRTKVDGLDQRVLEIRVGLRET